MGSCQAHPPARGGRYGRFRAPATALWIALALGGCGGGKNRKVPELQFEAETDSAGIARGPEILTAFEPIRYPNGLLQLRGGLRFPDHTRVQISIYPLGSRRPLQRVQVTVMNGRFESAPLLGGRGPMPVATYRFEFLAHFNSAWQPEDVLAVTNQGHDLRGPGMTRGNPNEAAFLLNREQRR